MPSEIIVEFPSPLTDKEKKMIYGYKGEVVRCKDCIHWYREYGENKCLEFADIPLEPNDFCSHGERRENETD